MFGLKSHKRGEGLGLVIEGGGCVTHTLRSRQTVLVKRFTTSSLVSLEMIYV